ncbi:MAG: hypothetical protein GOP50_03025 [Candidatus Heimdallarchaeota archaeon]|nr:hypothetical protein [Candidatus Heimdallarchaeota archaeon]
MNEETDVEAYFLRRVRIYNTFRWISLAMIIVGFAIFLIGYLLIWNIWIYPWIGGTIFLIALVLPFIVRRALKTKDPELLKHLVSNTEKE